MTKILTTFLLSTSLLLAPVLVWSQSPMGDQLRTVSFASVNGSYRCDKTKAPKVDVVITYELRPSSPERSQVTALTVQQEVVDKAKLLKINQAIKARGIENVLVNCSSTMVQVAFTVFDPKAAKRGYVVLQKRKDAALEVLL